MTVKDLTLQQVSTGMDLINIKARAKELNADLSFESSPGQGALLKLSANITQVRD